MTKYYGEKIDNLIKEGINTNAYTFIDNATKDLGAYTALTYFDNKITYDEFKEKVNLYANNLLSFGLYKGDSISLLMPNTPEIVYYFYACWILGIKVAPIDPRMNPEGIRDIIDKSNSKVLVAILDKYAEKVSPIIDKINVEKVVIVSPTDSMINNLKGKIGRAVYKYKELYLNMIDRDFSSNKVIRNKKFINPSKKGTVQPVYYESPLGMPAVNLFTSGTEGSPKIAVHSHEAYNAKAKQIEYTLPNAVPGDKFLGIIPFFSAYGSFQGMHNCLYRGMNIVLIPKFKPEEVPELILKHQPSTTIAVPNYWHDFKNRIDELMLKYGLTDLNFMKYAISGGDKQPSVDVAELIDIFKKYCPNCLFVRGYGSTEVGGATAVTVADPSYEDYEYTGVPMPGTKYLIAKEKENDDHGEVLISDPSMMMGYLNNQEETDRTIVTIDNEKYVKMGDIFIADVLDRLHFYGRTKRAVMRPDGHTVHVSPIEDAISKSNLVEQCCVVGTKKKDGTRGSIPTAFVVLKDGVSESQEIANELDKLSLMHLNERNRALAYVFVDEIPKTLMDKDNFTLLEKNYIEDLPFYPVDYTFLEKIPRPKYLNKNPHNKIS